jgi:hypothetical protein
MREKQASAPGARDDRIGRISTARPDGADMTAFPWRKEQSRECRRGRSRLVLSASQAELWRDARIAAGSGGLRYWRTMTEESTTPDPLELACRTSARHRRLVDHERLLVTGGVCVVPARAAVAR